MLLSTFILRYSATYPRCEAYGFDHIDNKTGKAVKGVGFPRKLLYFLQSSSNCLQIYHKISLLL